jgi:Lon protease-like protein
MKRRKLSKEEKRRRHAEYQAAWLKANPEQKRKKTLRQKARRAKKRAAKLIHLAAISKSSQSGQKVSTQ